MNRFLKSNNQPLIFSIGLVIFTILNLFSAYSMELHFDEAYYWIWAQSASFGYFDHPPMIAWLIKAGGLLLPGELGIRILVVMLSSFSMILLWKILKRYSHDALLFWALVYSICLIQPYSFFATPDAPLFFFTILFFYAYSRYLDKNNFQNAILLAFIIALLIYSKYHAFLLLSLVILSNLKMMKKFSFWLMLVISIIYLSPHILWLIDNNFPSFRYHLLESHKTSYHPITTIKYFFSEIAVTGPLLGWFFLYILFTKKSSNQWEKTLRYTGIGVFLFFFVTTFSGDFEAHWTLIAIIPLLILSYKHVIQNPNCKKWILTGGVISFVLLLALRIIIITPVAGHIKAFRQFSENKENVGKIKSITGNIPVLFQDDWIDASLFSYYSNDIKTGNLNSAFYRRNQFDIIDSDETLSGQSVMVLTTDSLQFEKSTKIITGRSVLYGKTFDNFHSYYNLNLEVKKLLKTSSIQDVMVTIRNPYEEDINIGYEAGCKASCQLWMKDGKKWELLSENIINNLQIPAESSSVIQTKFTITSSLLKGKEVYLTLKIGELKPLPSKCLLNF